MKKRLLPIALFLLLEITNAQAQLSLSLINPPFGFKYDLCNVSAAAALAPPSGGPNNNWVYQIANISPSSPYEVVDPSTVPSNYLTPVPTTDYVVRMKIAPTPAQDPMDFFDNTGTAIIRIGQKGSNSNPPDLKNDTLIHKNMKLGEGLKNQATQKIYHAWGKLTINNDVFDSVVVWKQHFIGMNDTAYYFYQTKPHFHYVGLLVFTNANMKGMQYYKPSSTSGFSNTNTLVANVYPNPSADNFTIQLEKAEAMQYELYNVNGQLVAQGFKEAGLQHQLNLAELPKGLYTLKILGVNSIGIQKLLKN